MAYGKELRIGQLAVQRAAILTQRVFKHKAKSPVSKPDNSPVTIGDFGAQALIISTLRANFPSDEIVAEEDGKNLKEDSILRSQTWELVRTTQLPDVFLEKLAGATVNDEGEMMALIESGDSNGGAKGRIWVIDPIDGTRGFLRNGQYAICLALLVDGVVQVGILGCPNLPIDDSVPLSSNIGINQTGETQNQGVMFSAVLGQGSTSKSLSPNSAPRNKISTRPLADIAGAILCESPKSKYAHILYQTGNTTIKMDSQAKYASIARGVGDIYLRLPRRDHPKIWDHAAGDLIVREAGGEVTDIYGKRLDFSAGRTLSNNTGIFVSPKGIHPQILAEVQKFSI